MRKFDLINLICLIGAGLSAMSLACERAQASDISWSGYYRFEAVRVHDSELSSLGLDKSYMLHHLVMQPKIVAGDGLTIYGRFDLLNNATYGTNNQFGEFLGSGPDSVYSGRTTPTNSTNSNVLSTSSASATIAVTQAYAVWSQEFGSVVVGRVPIQFGLGMVHDAGNGTFDHYFESHDIIGYKAVLGNFFFMPMIGKVDEGDIGQENEITDYMFDAEYVNPDTELSAGVFFQQRVASSYVNDAPTSGSSALGSSITGGYRQTTWSLFLKEKVGQFKIGVEGGFLSGDSGVYNTASGSTVGLNSFGVASELEYHGDESKWIWALKAGMATGGDPGNLNTNSTFAFNRNYDVAFLLFNHPLGQYDVLRTGQIRNTNVTASSQPDTEALSNALYFSPRVEWKIRENLSLIPVFTYALNNHDPVANGSTSRLLGYEQDISLIYKPYQRLTWKSTIGYFLPGGAWNGSGAVTYENRPAYGMETKAVISF